MLPAQIKAYNEVLENVIEQASSLDDQQKINAFVRMRQISSGFLPFVSDDGEERVVRFPSAKLAWLDELLTVMADDIQMIIFHEFILSGDGITALLKKHKLAHGWLYGGAKNKAQIIKDFQTGKTRILVANTAAGGMAIDLPQADYMLFYESPVAPITRQQAEARPLGRGAKPLVIDDLICSPIDRKVLGFVKEGKEALNSLIHDKRGWKLLRAR
jgi:SNF2 family DNA or RNA helicase